MAERAKCPSCGRRVAVTGKSVIAGHGSGDMPRGYAGGMVCPGSGAQADRIGEVMDTLKPGEVIKFPSGTRIETGGWCDCEEVNGGEPIDVRNDPCGVCGKWVRLPGGAV
jgi:hypothetical protein